MQEAARKAVEQNPQNAPLFSADALRTFSTTPHPSHIAALTSKWWRAGTVLGVQFIESPAQDFQQHVLSHMNAWSSQANIKFALTNTDPTVRITLRQDGYWSYVGTDILSISAQEPTMCLQNFDQGMPESEYFRVVRHETGHTLGFIHEHSRKEIVDLLDPQKTIVYFEQTQGWSPQMIQDQILTPQDPAALTALPAEELSIMCYQFPAQVTKNGQPIPGGTDITAEDYKLAGLIYPYTNTPPPTPSPPPPTQPLPPTPSVYPPGVDVTLDGHPAFSTISTPGTSANFNFSTSSTINIIFQVQMNLSFFVEPQVTLLAPQGSQQITVKGHSGRIDGIPPGDYQLQFKHPRHDKRTGVKLVCWKVN